MTRKKNKRRERNLPALTMTELVQKGDLPESFHLFDYEEMKEYQSTIYGFRDWMRRLEKPSHPKSQE